MQRERRLRRAAAPPSTLRAAEIRGPGLVKVQRSSTPERLRDLLAATIIRMQHVLDELDAVGGLEVRHV